MLTWIMGAFGFLTLCAVRLQVTVNAKFELLSSMLDFIRIIGVSFY